MPRVRPGAHAQYLNRMQRRKEWGGHLELQAISNMLKVNICVHQVSASTCPPVASYGTPASHAACYPQLAQPRWEIVNFPHAQVLHLSYHDGEHYNSVRNADDDGSDVPTPIVIRAPTAGPGAVVVVRPWQPRCVEALQTTCASRCSRYQPPRRAGRG